MKRLVAVVVFASLGTACVDKVEPGKGEVEQEQPPESPLPGPADGKADGAGNLVAVSVESAHPYANNLDRVYPIELAGRVPACADTARVHFTSIRTERGYDYVHLEGADGPFQSFDGDRTNVWSDWGPLGADLRLAIRLDTDGSIVKDGFRADAVEFTTAVRCPAVPQVQCPAGQVDVTPAPGPCECRGATRCAPADSVRLEHAIGGGFAGTITGSRAVGTRAERVVYQSGQPEAVTTIGTIDADRLQDVVDFVVAGDYLGRTGADEPSNWNETIHAAIGARAYTSLRPQGSHPEADAALIARVDELFVCGGTGALTCGSGFECDAGQCVERAGCVCPALYQPVCGVDGRTYGNGCSAACAEVSVRHTGECGIAGDPCGGLLAMECTGEHRCRYGASQFEAPYPDAAGTCVEGTYCDAPADCAGLVHPAVPGTWACEQNACAWRAGAAWQAFERFTTPHPYGNRASVWKQLYAPAGAAKVRLVTTGTFELERNYDFLEVHTWRNNRWELARRYTGTAGPSVTDELPGRYHYLRFVSDVSVVKYGFDVSAEWAN